MVSARYAFAWMWVAALVAFGAPAGAQTQQQIDRCNNKGGPFPPDLQIDACTASIQSGRWSGKGLAWAFIHRGIAYERKGDHDRAIADFSEAIRLDPTDARVFVNRGGAYQRATGDLDHAIADYNEAIRLDPKNVLAFNNRGRAHQDKGDLDRAVADDSEAIRLDPKFFAAFANRCRARALAGRDLAAALEDCATSLRLHPGDRYTFNSRALVQLKLGAFDGAIADYGAAIAQDPKDADSLYGRGVARLKRGDTTGGNADIAAATAIKADIAKVYAGYGIAAN